MNLSELTAGIDAETHFPTRSGGDARSREGGGDPEIAGLAYDSRAVGPGFLFFCVTGLETDGHEFARDAIAAGAAALVVERRLELEVPQALVGNARVAMAPLAARFFGDPTSELAVAGVTGTNGKTTTAFLLREVIEASGRSCGLLGTVKRVVGGVDEEVVRTTPEAIDMQADLRRMRDAGDEACAMEVSSHALVLHRADAIHFDAKVFTNLTQDHLDFHADMEDYYAAKRLLFELEEGTAVVNVDDPYGRRLAEDFECRTYSASGIEADYRAEGITYDTASASFRALTPSGEVEVRTALPGHFNVSNALAAIAGAHVLGVDPTDAAAALAEAGRVPGRFEPIDEGQPFTVLVDYAHTPDSLDNVLRSARRLTEGKLIAVFGCGGDRDREKRPLMGQIGAALSDIAIVTSDNPRSEDPEAIIAEILAGTDGSSSSQGDPRTREPSGSEAKSGRAGGDPDHVLVEPDRRAAIAMALRQAVPGDIVVIAGKGHEQGQEFEHGRKVPFDDREVTREELRRLPAAS